MKAAPIYCKKKDPTNASLWVIHINVPEIGNVKEVSLRAYKCRSKHRNANAVRTSPDIL